MRIKKNWVTKSDLSNVLDITPFDWQESVVDRTNTPPANPSNGDRYLVVAVASGDWTGHENDIATYQNGWQFVTPTAGSAIFIEDEAVTIFYTGSAWTGTFKLDADLALTDNNQLYFGSDNDFWFEYDETTDDALELWGNDVDGAGSDGVIFSVDKGTDDVAFSGRLFNGSAALNLGSAAATSHGLGTNDVLVGGKLEVDGTLYMDSGAQVAAQYSIYGGTIGEYGALVLANSGQTVGAPQMLTGATGNYWIFAEYADRAKNFDHAQQTNPTFFIHSATDPDTDNTQWLSLSHNQTNGVIATGTNSLEITPAAILMANLPASDPSVAGQLYADSADGYTVKVSQG